MDDQDLRKAIIRVAHENPGEVREALLPLLKDAAGSRYPTPKEVIKFATDVANLIYKARGGMSNMLDVLQKAYEDSRGTGVSFTGNVATQFSDRLKKVKDEVDETNHAMYNVANSLEVLARDLKRAKTGAVKPRSAAKRPITEEDLEAWKTKPPIRFTRWESVKPTFDWQDALWYQKGLNLSVVVRHDSVISKDNYYTEIHTGYPAGGFMQVRAGGFEKKFSNKQAALREAKNMMANPIAYNLGPAGVKPEALLKFLNQRWRHL